MVVTLADGSQINYTGPFDYNKPPTILNEDALGGAAESVQRMYTSGAPEDIPSNRIAAVDSEFDQVTVGLTMENQTNGTSGGSRPVVRNAEPSPASGCTVGHRGPAQGIFLLGLLALVALVSLRKSRRGQA